MNAASSVAAGSARSRGLGDRKRQRDAGVEQKVQRDVEKRAAVGGLRLASQRTVEPVAQAAGQHQRQAQRGTPRGDRQRGADPQPKAQPRDAIGVHAPGVQQAGAAAPGRGRSQRISVRSSMRVARAAHERGRRGGLARLRIGGIVPATDARRFTPARCARAADAPGVDRQAAGPPQQQADQQAAPEDVLLQRRLGDVHRGSAPPPR